MPGGMKSTIGDNLVEQALIQALAKANNQEVKTFLIDRLVFCGSNESINPLVNI